VNGLKQGDAKTYYDNGAINIESNYKDNRLHGPMTVFHENGTISGTVSHNNGKIEGSWKFYDSLGQILEERVFKDSVLIKTIDYRKKSKD
jgi:antitoxin component YwqK of YwqJK toxin-antitoxin module